MWWEFSAYSNILQKRTKHMHSTCVLHAAQLQCWMDFAGSVYAVEQRHCMMEQQWGEGGCLKGGAQRSPVARHDRCWMFRLCVAYINSCYSCSNNTYLV